MWTGVWRCCTKRKRGEREKKYGVEIVDRPKIRPTKELNLKGKEGEKIIRLLTKKILIRHEKTFKRLSEM